MALVNQDLVLDVVPGPIPPILHLTEYDENMEVVVTLQRRGQPFQIPSGTTVKIEGTLKGHPFSEDGTPSGNTVTFMVSKNMTAYSGRAWTKVVLTKDSKPVSTCGFWLDCDRAGVEADTVIGAPGFEEQIADAAEAWLEEQGFSSPTIGVTEITGGHRITVTDYQGSDSFDVMDGEDVVTDDTLSIEGAAADAKAVGSQLARVKSALAGKTRNLFDKTSITIGVNAAGAAASRNRALSGAIKVSGTAVYFAKTLPTNIKYEIERYSGAEASTLTGSVSGGWNTTNTWRQYTNSETYIRVLFGTVDNTAFSMHDFDELEMCVLDTPVLSEYIPHLTATDYTARESIEATENDVNEIAELSRNLFDKKEIQIGLDETGSPNMYRAISGAMHVGNLNSAVLAYNIDGLQYTVAFYSSDDISDYKTIRGGGSFIADTLSHFQTQADYPYPYARIVLRRSDGTQINQSDLDNLVLQFETGNGSSDYIPYHTAYDYIARKNIETLAVCTWNVGLWNNGVTPYMNLENLYKWYRIIGDAKTDLFLTQESPIQLDENNTLSYNSFFGSLYSYVVSPQTGESNYTAKGVATKMHQSNTTRNFYEDGVRTYLKSYITVNGKLVCLINTHIDFDQTRRTAELGELLSVMNAEERVIVCGDFNVTDFSEYAGFTSAGYRLANHGIFGDFATCPNASPITAIDNIIVSNNIRIVNVRVVDGAGADGLSDHNPLLATLEI